MSVCPFCHNWFHHLGLATHRAACRKKPMRSTVRPERIARKLSQTQQIALVAIANTGKWSAMQWRTDESLHTRGLIDRGVYEGEHPKLTELGKRVFYILEGNE